MSDYGFQMPEFIAGDHSEVTPDSEGAENAGKVWGGLVIFLTLLSLAVAAKDRIMGVFEQKTQGDDGGLSFKGEL